jgi:hypothetical protein
LSGLVLPFPGRPSAPGKAPRRYGYGFVFLAEGGLAAVEPDLGFAGVLVEEDDLPVLALDALPGDFVALDDDLSGPVFEVVAEGFEAGFDAVSEDLGLAAGVALGFAGGFDDAAPDVVLFVEVEVWLAGFPALVDVLLAGWEATLPVEAGDLLEGAGVAFARPEGPEDAFAPWPVTFGFAAAWVDDGNSEISPRISFSRSAREIDRPFISLTAMSSAGATPRCATGCDGFPAGPPAEGLAAALTACVSGAAFGTADGAFSPGGGANGN